MKERHYECVEEKVYRINNSTYALKMGLAQRIVFVILLSRILVYIYIRDTCTKQS